MSWKHQQKHKQAVKRGLHRGRGLHGGEPAGRILELLCRLFKVKSRRVCILAWDIGNVRPFGNMHGETSTFPIWRWDEMKQQKRKSNLKTIKPSALNPFHFQRIFELASQAAAWIVQCIQMAPQTAELTCLCYCLGASFASRHSGKRFRAHKVWPSGWRSELGSRASSLGQSVEQKQLPSGKFPNFGPQLWAISIQNS